MVTDVWGMLYPIINKKSPISIRNDVNIQKMYVLAILTYAGVEWIPLSGK